MYSFPLVLIGIFSGLFVLRVVLDTSKVYEFSFILSAFLIAWYIPQSLSVHRTTDQFEPFDIVSVDWQTFGAFLMTLTGFYLGRHWAVKHRSINRSKQNRELSSNSSGRILQKGYSAKRLAYSSIALFFIGLFCVYQVSALHVTQVGNFSGKIAAYYAFTPAIIWGMSIALFLAIHIKQKQYVWLAIAMISIVCLNIVLGVSFKRSAVFEFGVIVGISLAVGFRIFPPRSALIIAFFLGTVILNFAGDIRNDMEVSNSNFIQAVVGLEFDWSAVLENEVAPEVRQAASDLYLVQKTQYYSNGASYWNTIISFVFPSYIFGRDSEEALKIDLADDPLPELQYGHYGATRTGMSDTYRAFGRIGVIVFLIVGLGIGYAYSSMLMGSFVGFVIYSGVINEGLLMFSHSTSEFPARIIYFIIAIVLVHYFSRNHIYRVIT